MSPPNVTHSIKRSIHNYDEIYAQTKTLFQCKFNFFFLKISLTLSDSLLRHFQLFFRFYRFLAKKLPKNVNKTAVFACNELDLEEIQVYGFDYDYTLANYKKSLHYLLYDLARDMLVEKYKVSDMTIWLNPIFLPPVFFFVHSMCNYFTIFSLIASIQYPEAIKSLEYLPGFAIRGLHYDIEKGLLLKLDSFLQIQLGSVYRGLTPVSDAEVIRLYRNRVVPLGMYFKLFAKF